MWDVFKQKIMYIVEAYKMEYEIYSWWSATGVCVVATILNVILLVPNLIYLIWSSWYIHNWNKKWNGEV